MCSDLVISVKNVSKCYELYDKPLDRLKQILSLKHKKYYKEFWAVKNISFDIKRGEIVGILGRNGSGKSTLLQMIAGTLQVSSGKIETKGTLAALLELGSGFNPDFSGHDNIYLNGTILGLTKKEIDKYYDEIVEFADIGQHLFQPVKTYSSGMTVRLAFAVQACIRPEILIVDEALSVGDEKFQRKCFDYIDTLKKEGCSILLVTHSTSTVEKFCQKGILLHEGIMHGIGDAKDIVDQYHALLYTDREEYYKRLTSITASAALPAIVDNNVTPNNLSDQLIKGCRANIQRVLIGTETENNVEYVKTGDKIIVQIYVDIYESIEELQAGILFRTVEGISAYGTSTMYFDKNVRGLVKGNCIEIQFSFDLFLSPGTYFLTASIANALVNGDMQYLDKKTDIVSLKVDQMKPHSNGIAYLPTQISINKI